MTVTSSINYKEYQANGIATTFAIPFLLLDRRDLKVYLDNQPYTQSYTIRGIGNPICEIIFDSAPLGKLRLQRSIELIRETDYQENGDLLARTINQDFDRIYLAMQGFAHDYKKALRVTDPEGINDLPLADERANKFLSFDTTGQPLLASVGTGSAVELAQNLSDTSNANKGSGIVGHEKSLSYPNRTIGNAVNTLTNRFDVFEGNGVPMFAVFWWPSRSNIPAGYVAADGQELSAATYPAAAKDIAAGKVPLVSESAWKSDPVKRGSYVAKSSNDMFRLPDYNGRYADSLGALFLRGDNGKVPNGAVQRDSMRDIDIPISYSTYGQGFAASHHQDRVMFSPGFSLPSDVSGWNGLNSAALAARRGTNKLVLGEETCPINICGCWIIKLFGAVVNAGNADMQKLVSDYANLSARFSELESYQKAKKFTIIYPNGGTKENPATIALNSSYEMNNPFLNESVICEAEILINGEWGITGWIYATGGMGVLASQFNDTIIVRTGSAAFASNKANSGTPLNFSGNWGAPPPCRVKVWRIN